MVLSTPIFNIEPDVRAFAVGIFMLFPLRLIFLNLTYLLIGQEDIKTYNKLLVLQRLGTSMLGIFLIIVLSLGISGALAGSLAGASVAIMCAVVESHCRDNLSRNLNKKLFPQLGRYASQFYAGNVLGYFQNNIQALSTQYS
jgi:O-antigen/teichoic acid export membrane protein